MTSFVVEQAGFATVQDLGRPGYAHIGIPVNGACDQQSARTANALVGNAPGAALLEVTGSRLELRAESDLLVSVTGSPEHLLVDGHLEPAYEPVAVPRGAQVTVPPGPHGLRAYLAVNGRLDAELVLGSVAPDPLLGVGRRLGPGDRVHVDSNYRLEHPAPYGPLFRLGATRPALSGAAEIQAVPGPDVHRMTLGAACLIDRYEVTAQSNHVGLRLTGDVGGQQPGPEIRSRGVPVGAIEVPPAGGVLILLRGRLVTAGYPVVAVATTASLDRLGQVRPGDRVRIVTCDLRQAQVALRASHAAIAAVAARARRALVASGLGDILDPAHGAAAVDTSSAAPELRIRFGAPAPG